MSLLGTFLLVHVFTAVLPPKDADDDDEEYYHILGLEPSRSRTSFEDIKKAYRTLSLELHPDKIAQRGDDNNNAEAAASRYEKVQQAYAVLSDHEQRAKYHSVNCSPERYKFVYQQGWMHPTSLIDNVSRASFWDKSRLVLLVLLFLLILLLQPILIAIKLNADLSDGNETALEEVSWNVILIPFWVLYGGYALLLFVAFLWSKRRDLLLDFLQHICIFVGSGLVVREWDRAEGRPMASAQWYHIATPYYLAVLFKAAALSERVRSLTKVLDKLVSPDAMEQLQREAQTREPDWTIEQLDALRAQFVVVTPDDLQVAATLAVMESTGETLTDDELEALKVQTSPEYERLQGQINRTSIQILRVLVYPTTFISLVAAKLEERIECTWWVVFIPIWVHCGLQILQSCCTCFCVAGGGAMDIVEDEHDDDDDPDGDGVEGYADDENDDNEPTLNTLEENGDAAVVENGEGAANDTQLDQEKSNDENDAETAPQSKNEANDATKPDDKGASSAETQPDSDEDSPSAEKQPDSEPENGGDSGDIDGEHADEKEDKLASLKEDVIGEESRKDMDPLTPAFPRSGVSTAAAPTESAELFEPAQSNTFFNKVKADEDEERKKERQEQERQRYENEGDIPELDQEEAFRQWQRAHAQDADNEAMETQLRAQWICCVNSFILLTIGMAVAKLEDSFGGEEGFNSFIVLIPTFFVAGIILCCCCCLVYTAPDMSKMEELMGQHEDAPPQQDEEEAIPMPMPAPAPPTEEGEETPSSPAETADETPREQTSSISEHDEKKETTPDIENGVGGEETAEDINDLD